MDLQVASSNEEKTDWFEELSGEQQKDIMESLIQADNSQAVSHTKALKLFGKWSLK